MILTGDKLATDILGCISAITRNSPTQVYLRIIGDKKLYENSSYYRGIAKDAEYCGIKILHTTYEEDRICCGEIALIPEYEQRIQSIDNLDGGCFFPCTAEAIMELLQYWHISVLGKNVCIIGRSNRVGRPLAGLMDANDATVTLCHSKTRNLMDHIENSDIVVSCTGNQNLFNKDSKIICRDGALVVDVGGEFVNTSVQCEKHVPYKGGVGPVTRAVLLRHAVQWYFSKLR